MKHLIAACLKQLKNPVVANYEINLESYKKDPSIISVYATKKINGQEAYVIRKFGNDKYRYIGKLGAGTGSLQDLVKEIKSALDRKKQLTLVYGKDITNLKNPVVADTPTKKENPQIQTLQNQIDSLLNQIQQQNKKLDNTSLTPQQKEAIHDTLDRLKDRRKQTSLKLSDLKIRESKKK